MAVTGTIASSARRERRHEPDVAQVGCTSSSARRDCGWAVASSVLLWMSFPPLHAWPLAWIAPCGWLRLVRQPVWHVSRPYRLMYAVGLLHWLLLIQWVRLPHWSAYFGWWALAAYLAVYVPLFVALSRVLVHRCGISSVVAAPLVWTGLEWLRSHLFTGFSLALLGHSQVQVLPIIQIADLVGAYGVSFLVMFVASCCERLVPLAGERPVRWPLTAAAVALLLCGGYGAARLTQQPLADTEPRRLRAALIQSAFDTQFDGDMERSRQAFFDYARLSRQAAREYGDLDLIIWPESMFSGTGPMVTYEPPVQMIPGWEGSLAELQQRLDDHEASVRQRFAWVAQQVRTPLLVGSAWDHFTHGTSQRFNSAVFSDRQGRIVGRYDKMHPVMFGEYVPLGDWFPWLYRLTPMYDGLTAGQAPQSFRVGEVRVSPTICFENTVPHLVRGQVRQLQRQGEAPDVLVTITNDGWFWGSSLLDIHLSCGIFRAIELRRPLLIAANTGFSAWIDDTGRVREQGPRRAEGTLLADVVIWPRRHSVYLALGDWFAAGCLGLVLLGCVFARMRSRAALAISA